MLWKHKSINRTQTRSETHRAHSIHNTGRTYTREQSMSVGKIHSMFFFPSFFLHNYFPLESLAPVTADTPFTGRNDETPLLCLLASSRKESTLSGPKYEITLSLEASARWSRCIMLVVQPVWILSVSDCAVNSPPFCLSHWQRR